MTTLAWHFLHPGGELRDGRAAPPDGEWLTQSGTIEPCRKGLHASERALDALRFHPRMARAPLCRVELRGTIVPHGDPVDKLVASERRILWRLDGETTDTVLREFARWSALQVVHLWDAPEVVKRWLEAGDETLRYAARDAAWAAAGVAAWAAARNAAWAAAGAAAWVAAGVAAGVAARNAQNTHLERLFTEAHEGKGKDDA